MLPTLSDGDEILVNTADTQIEDNKIFAIIMSGDLFVKRLAKTYNGGLDIISDNDFYAKITIPPGDLEYVSIIGRAVHRTGNL